MCCLCLIPKMKALDQFEKKNIPSDLWWRTSIKPAHQLSMTVLKPKSQNIVQAQVILLNKQAKQTLIELLASSLAIFLTLQYLRTALHMYLPKARKELEEQVFQALF